MSMDKASAGGHSIKNAGNSTSQHPSVNKSGTNSARVSGGTSPTAVSGGKQEKAS